MQMNYFTSSVVFYIVMVGIRLEALNKGSSTNGIRHLQYRLELVCISYVSC